MRGVGRKSVTGNLMTSQDNNPGKCLLIYVGISIKGSFDKGVCSRESGLSLRGSVMSRFYSGYLITNKGYASVYTRLELHLGTRQGASNFGIVKLLLQFSASLNLKQINLLLLWTMTLTASRPS